MRPSSASAVTLTPCLCLLLLTGSSAQDEPARAGDDAAVSALDAALAELGTPEGGRAPGAGSLAAGDDLWSRQVGAVNLRLLDLSVDVLAAVGGSSERDESLQTLQGGGHDPRKRGFTLQNVELSAQAAVDPYFTGEVHIIYFLDPLEGESTLELEEAFLTTLALPFGLEEHGLQLEFGHFFTEVGRLNPRHPHAWEWLDQPIINTRLFGPDGMRAPGFRIGWLSPLPWFSELHFGMQNANGETMASFLANDEFFEERPVGGRPFTERDVRSLEDLVYLLRWDNAWDLGEEVTVKLGASALLGPNATGPDGRTYIYGADFLLKWRPLDSDRGWPFVIWQTEVMKRDYRADDFDDGMTTLAATTLRDWGLYTQVLWGFERDWAAGLRYEYAGGDKPSVGDFAERDEDPFRDDRHRLSPLLTWQPTEFSRVRLQYNADFADHLRSDDAHSLWLGFEIGFGKHAAHTF